MLTAREKACRVLVSHNFITTNHSAVAQFNRTTATSSFLLAVCLSMCHNSLFGNHFVKMPESSVSKCEKTQWTGARRTICLVLLVLMTGTVMLTVYISNQAPWFSWTTSSWLLQSHNNMTFGTVQEPHVQISPADPSAEFFVAYPHRYTFILDEHDRCRQESPFLVLVIPVAPHNREARDTIRKTWGKESTVLGRVVSLYFLLGLSKEEDGTEALQKQVLEESQTHHDILQSNFLDSYKNLTIKTMVMLEWLSSHCPNTAYAMKVDSDMFLNVHKLVDMLLKAPQHLYMTGNVARGAAVLRDHNSKWFLPVSVFSDPTYPPYALGLGYVFSMDLPKKIVDASAHVKAIYIEDVYVGMCMKNLGIEVTDPPNGGLFRTTIPFHSVSMKCYWTSVITTILDNSKQISDTWRKYQTEAQSGC